MKHDYSYDVPIIGDSARAFETSAKLHIESSISNFQ
jgi:hypothetical protein